MKSLMQCFDRHSRRSSAPFISAFILFISTFVTGSFSFANDIPGLYSPAANEAVIYYKRADGNYDGWGLHLWDPDDGRVAVPNEIVNATDWEAPQEATGLSDMYGAYYVVELNTPDWQDFMFIMHKGSDKDLGGLDHTYVRSNFGSDIFTFQGVSELFVDPITEAPVSIEGASAHWISRNVILANAHPAAVETRLYFAADAALELTEEKQLTGGGFHTLYETEKPDGLDARFAEKAAYSIDLVDRDIRKMLQRQLVLAQLDAAGKVVVATKVQLPEILDELYVGALDETLGATLNRRSTEFALWAPTAQKVKIELYYPRVNGTKRKIATLKMKKDEVTGVWNKRIWWPLRGWFYRYEITVYHPETNKLETVHVTDPYSLSLSANSELSQIVDMDARWTQPRRWNDATDFVVENPEDIVIYESHIRDISMADERGREFYNGKYLAFTENRRASMRHLDDLANAGLTHMHLLPAFDIATINENVSERVELQDDFALLCEVSTFAATEYAHYCNSGLTVEDVMNTLDPSTADIQALNEELLQVDAFNWGYDPFHYTVPEGSYATNPDGTARIREFRAMVQALHNKGLNVVMDVVYNHTNASGLNPKSVLDKVVPGYYHRLNTESGAVETSTCCMNTASEHLMMEKLMIDSLVVWARDYQIDAFRFDLMGHHMKSNMEKALAAVQEVRPHVYFYGEGWNFGEVADGARGENAIQWNMGGTGIGSFTDRLRDAVRGGGPFDGGEALRQNQGFANGLYTLPNELNSGSAAERDSLLAAQDLIRVGMAGNLQEFIIEDRTGATARGKDLDYNGARAGYALDPQEIVNYVSKHDNQTLWDNNQYKIATGTSAEDRTRMQNIALSIPLLSQGVPFIHMGSDLLRSKSFLRDSYDSGDWFNRVDFTGRENNWNVGLPKASLDGSNWPVIEPIIADATTETTAVDIDFAKRVFQEFLQVRSQSKLFRLTTAEDIQARVDFRNTGVDQIPGLIAMTIDDGVNVSDMDASVDALIVLINATPDAIQFADDAFAGADVFGALRHSVDMNQYLVSVNGSNVTIPAFTTTVLAITQHGVQGEGIPVSAKDLSNIPAYGTTTVYARGSFNGWSTDNAFQFEGNHTYGMTVEVAAGDYEFKIASDDWSTVNFGADATLVDAGTLTLENGGNNVRLQVTAPQTLRFELNAENPNSPTLTVTPADVAPYGATTVYLRGSLNGWGTSDAFGYWGEGIYSLHTNIAAGDYQFKVAEANWSEPNLGVNGGALTIGDTLTLMPGEGDIALSIPTTGDYSFVLDANDTSMPTLTLLNDAPLYGTTDLYVRGSLNGWGTDDALTYIGAQQYQLNKTLAAGSYEFKIASEDWSTANWGADSAIENSGSVTGVASGNNIALNLSSDATVTFTVDYTLPNSPKVSVE